MGNIVRTSESATLALHAMGILAGRPGSISAHRIAETLGASEATLAKVMQRLVKAGLVTSRRGPHGGFELAKPSEDVTLLDVYESIEGEIEVTHCLLDAPVCGAQSCPLARVFERAGQEIVKELARTTLAEFRISTKE
ncbi:Rrf2 family transcriptional regulator [bacterium]|nr:Rrf2 family transcriptional regulator [bacterium]